MKVKRVHEMAQLEREVILMLWKDIQKLPAYSTWRKYERGFVYEGKPYRFKCKFMIEGGHLKMIESKIAHEQVVIDLLH